MVVMALLSSSGRWNSLTRANIAFLLRSLISWSDYLSFTEEEAYLQLHTAKGHGSAQKDQLRCVSCFFFGMISPLHG